MATDFDAYRTLGLDPSAPPALVQAAYEQQRQRHQDDPERLREIETAYRLLGDPEQRAEYDERRRERLQTAGQPGSLPTAPAGELWAAGAPAVEAVPWTLGDMLKALILPFILVALNVAGGFLSDVEEDDLSSTDYIINFAFGFVVEAALFGVAYWFTVRKYGVSWATLGFRWPQGLRWWFPFLLLGIALTLIYAYIAVLSAAGVEPDSNVPEGAYDDVAPMILLGVLSVLAAPLVEEFFFRAFLFQGLARRYGPYLGIAFSALLFGSVHLAGPDTFLIFPPIALIGAVFAWGFWRHRSIYPVIIAHLMFNGLSFVAGIFS